MIILAYILTAIYFIIILSYTFGWSRFKEWQYSEKNHTTKVSVIIPARNEEEHIVACLQSIAKQTYNSNLYEIILVDDHSEDETVRFATDANLTNLKIIKLSDINIHIENSYKKAALACGIENASGDLILTTDADCIVPHEWIKYMVAYYEKEKPVIFSSHIQLNPNISLVDKFQALDIIGMMCVTAASYFLKIGWMSNGANLAYEKKIFQELQGFKGIDQIASGDDFLFIQKVAEKYPNRIGYLKSKHTIVKTYPEKGIRDFIRQRIRWASKSRFYKDKRIITVLAMIYFYHLIILYFLTTAIFINTENFKIFLLLLLLKMLVEFPFLLITSKFFKQQSLMLYFVPAQLLHIIYILTAGFLGNFKKYEWKGRKVR